MTISVRVFLTERSFKRIITECRNPASPSLIQFLLKTVIYVTAPQQSDSKLGE